MYTKWGLKRFVNNLKKQWDTLKPAQWAAYTVAVNYKNYFPYIVVRKGNHSADWSIDASRFSFFVNISDIDVINALERLRNQVDEEIAISERHAELFRMGVDVEPVIQEYYEDGLICRAMYLDVTFKGMSNIISAMKENGCLRNELYVDYVIDCFAQNACGHPVGENDRCLVLDYESWIECVESVRISRLEKERKEISRENDMKNLLSMVNQRISE